MKCKYCGFEWVECDEQRNFCLDDVCVYCCETRDRFAAAALTGLFSVSQEFPTYGVASKRAFEYADAMMKARKGE